MKGMEKKYFGTRHFIEKGYIYLQKIGTAGQFADIGTKSLNKTTLLVYETLIWLVILFLNLNVQEFIDDEIGLFTSGKYC